MTKARKAGDLAEVVGIRIRRRDVVILNRIEILGLSAAYRSNRFVQVVTLCLFVAFFGNRTAEFRRELAG